MAGAICLQQSQMDLKCVWGRKKEKELSTSSSGLEIKAICVCLSHAHCFPSLSSLSIFFPLSLPLSVRVAIKCHKQCAFQAIKAQHIKNKLLYLLYGMVCARRAARGEVRGKAPSMLPLVCGARINALYVQFAIYRAHTYL